MSSTPARRDASLSHDGVLLAATFVWGCSFVVVHAALEEISPLLFVALRFSVAAILLVPVSVRLHGRPDRRSLRGGAEVGAWLFLGFAFQTAGLTSCPPARAAFLTGLSVVMVPVLALLLHRRRPSADALAGVVLATAGLGLLTGVGSPAGAGAGDLLVLAGAGAFALQILAVDRHTRSLGPGRLLLGELWTVALLAWPAVALLESPKLEGGWKGWGGVATMALFATLGALWAQNWSQLRTPPTRAAVILTLEPVFAALVSYAITGERFGPSEIVGSLLILAGMLAAELLPRLPRRASR